MRLHSFASPRRMLLCGAALALLLMVVALPAGHSATRQAAADTPAPTEPVTPAQIERSAAVPTTQECIDAGLRACYTPQQVRTAYDIQPLIDAGIDGSGQGIVIIVSFGSPTLLADIAAFDQAMGLPHADVQQLYPLGHDFTGQDPQDISGWAFETTIDAEWAHAIAPAAKITVLASPVAETEGTVGLPEFRQLVEYALDNHLGDVISQSWGTTENWLADDAGAAERQAWQQLYARATAAGVTIVSASGDHGALSDTWTGGIGRGRAVDWPASESDVTAVGGTTLTLNDDGSYGSETVWRDSGDASGGGVSSLNAEPDYQGLIAQPQQDQLGGMRGVADVSALAQGLILYFAEGGAHNGPHADPGGGGTSASTPIWAGIVALADQAAGHGLGNINPSLYQLGAAGECFHDVTDGSSRLAGDPGEPAGPGWDFPTGWGSPDAACLVPALADGAQQVAP